MPNIRSTGTVRVTVPMPLALKVQLKELATRDERPLAHFIRMQLTKLTRKSKAARRRPNPAPDMAPAISL